MQHIWTIFNKNTHTHERSAIEIDEKKNIQDNFIHTLLFSLIKIQRNENTFLIEIYNIFLNLQFFIVIIRVCCNTTSHFPALY